MFSFTDVFDKNTLIDFDKIKKVIEKYEGKKKIFFGSGTAAELLMDNLLSNYEIECFLDNNKALWGTKIGNAEIRSPEYLKQLSKGDYVVFIVNRYIQAISKQLEEIGLEYNIDFIDLYQEFLPYFRVGKFEKSTVKFKNFIERIPEDTFKNIAIKHEQHIGVICGASMAAFQTWYPMAIFLLLKYMGYNVSLIMDNMYSFDDLVFFNRHSEILKHYTDYIIQIMKERFVDIDVRYINPEDKAELDETDLQEIERIIKYNLIWQNARRDEMLHIDVKDREELYRTILKDNLTSIKAFFEKNKFDSLNVISGIHKSKGLYTWEGKRYGIRVSNYDGSGVGHSTLCATNHPSGHHYDIIRMIKEDMLDETTRDEIVEKVTKIFQNRINATREQGEYNFQLTSEVSKNQKYYDVVMPLNINCDSAALGLDRVFANEKEWIIETVDYILNNTNAAIIIREHPSVITDIWKNTCMVRHGEVINKLYNTDRVYFCSGNEAINTYRMIEKCKVVLPYTSTVGVEAALMDKAVITHTNVYYADLGFVYNAKSKEEYFSLIKAAVEEKIQVKKFDKDIPYIALYDILNCTVKTEFLEFLDGWMDCTLEELVKLDGVENLIKIFGDGTPTLITKLS